MIRNKLLSKYNIYEEVDELGVMNDTKNKSIDHFFPLGDDSSKNLFNDVKVKSIALFPPDEKQLWEEVKSQCIDINSNTEENPKETCVITRNDNDSDLLGLKNLYTNWSGI